MFRSVKRRKKDGRNTISTRIIRTTNEDDSDDEQQDLNINAAEKDENGSRVDDEAKTRISDKNSAGGGAGAGSSREEEGIVFKEIKEKKKSKKKKEKKQKEDKDKDKKSKKKMKILRQPPPSLFSFHDEDLDEMDVDGEIVLTNKNVGFGSGGGGSRGSEGGRIQRMMNVNMHDDDDDNDNDVDMQVDSEQGPGPDTSSTGLSYDKKAIDRLKKEQEQMQQTNREDPEGNRPQPSSTSSLQQQQNLQGTTNMTEESFISLDGEGEEATTIIAGDDALKHTMNLNGLQAEHDDDMAADRSAAETGYLGSSPRNIDGIDNSNSTDNDNDNDWEEQVSRRALGSAATSAKPTILTTETRSSSLLSSSSRLVSLDLVQSQLQSTIDTLHIRQEEIGNTINRHATDLKHTVKEYNEQKQALEKTGRSLEEYQKLRNDLTLWCGALRDLQHKVRPIMDGYQSMIVQQLEEAGTEFQSWQDDTIAILSETKMIEKVLGRQPADIPTNETTVIIDEFGRDVKSQYLRERDVRSKRRQDQLSNTYSVDEVVKGDQSKSINVDILVRSLYEDGGELERSDLLQEALKAALQDLDPTYTAVNNLLELFQKWKSTYPDEYQQCYADLSLGDLASVMLQIRFCQSSWFPRMLTIMEDGFDDEKYQADLKDLVTNQGYPPTASSRCIEKALVPLVLKILEVIPSSCIFLSTTKSLLLSKLLQDLFQFLERSSNNRKTLEDACKKAVISSLDNLAIPIYHRSSDAQTPQSNIIDVELSRKYTLSYQATMISQMLSNIIDCFFCLMPKDENGDEKIDEDGMAATVLRFINDGFIYLLSSMEKERAKEAFTPVYEKLRIDGKILNSPSLFLVSMPLRAAAKAYGLD